MLAVLLALTSGVPVPHLPAGPPVHYRLDLTGSLRFEGSVTDTVGRNGDATATVFLTATMRDTVGGRVARVVIDSAECRGAGILSMAFDPSVATRSKGTWYDVVLISGTSYVVPEASLRNTLTSRIGLVVRNLFPPIHPILIEGAVFADTVDVRSSSDRWAQSGPTVTKWKVTEMNASRTVLDGEVTGVVNVTGRVMATGLVVGHRSMTLSPEGVVTNATLTTSQQTLLTPQDNSEILRAIVTTSATVAEVKPQP